MKPALISLALNIPAKSPDLSSRLSTKPRQRVKATRPILIGGLSLLLLQAASTAAVLTWDANATFDGTIGGTGTWNATNSNWSGASSDVRWTDTSATGTDTAVFAGVGPYTVTLASNASALRLSFTATPQAGTVTISSTSSLNPTLTIGSGGIDIVNGVTLGSSTAANNIRIQLAADQTWKLGTGVFNSSATITNTAGSGTTTLTVSGSGGNTYTFAGVVSDGANAKTAMKLSGAVGLMVLSATNTYSGGMSLSGSAASVSGTMVTIVAANSTGSVGNVTGGAFGKGTVTVTTGTQYLRCSSSSTANVLNDFLLNGDLYFVANAKTLTLAGGVTLGGDRKISVESAGASNASDLISGVITDNGNSYRLTKVGVGMLELSGANTYGGGTTVTTGTLKVSNTGGSATGSGTVAMGASTTLMGTGIISNTVNLSGSNILIGGTGNGTLTTGGIIVDGLNNRISSGNVTGSITQHASSGLIVDGTAGNASLATSATLSGTGTVGAVTLAGSNDLSSMGTLTTGGVTVNGSANQLSSGIIAGAVTINPNGSLAVQGTLAGNMNVGSGTVSGTGTINGTTDVTGGTINGTGLTLSSLATFHGANNTLGGTVKATTGISVASTANLSLSGTVTGNATVNSGATLQGSGKVDGTVAVTSATINGSGLHLGATTLNGASTVSGTTTASSIAVSTGTTSIGGITDSGSSLTVSAGANLNNTGSTTATSVTVDHGATLNNNGTLTGAVNVTGVFNGTGTVDGALTIKSTGELAPGNSPGITTVTGALTVEGGAKVSMQLDGLTAGALTNGYDQIVVTDTGSVTLLNGSILDITFGNGLSLATNDRFVLIDNQSGAIISGTFNSLLISGSSVTLDANNIFNYNDQQYQLSYTGVAGTDSVANDLVLTVVPEPSTWAIMLGGIGMLGIGQRLRRRCRS